ncbi:MAG: N-acetylglucosamine-6-phosphate deacetylase [Spirosomataceae bacterium]
MTTTLSNLTIHTGTEVLKNHSIEVENGLIKAIFPSNTTSSTNKHIAPALIDLHINGGEQFYFTQHPTEETIDDIYQSCLKMGTGYVLPTLITSPTENILKGIESTRNYLAKNPNSGVLGMHLEGPFLNPTKRGAHLAEYVRKPTNAELEEIIKYGKGIIKIMTIAPEQFTDEQIEMLIESGITISAGHSNATYKQASHAFGLGIRLITHLFNAMSQMGHREVGLVGATFDNDAVYAPIILDGFHCDYAAARIAHKAKKDKLFLISDALFVGDKVKQFQWGEFDAYLKDGQYRNSEGNLAGAAIAMGDAVRNATKFVNISLQEAIEMATIRPAEAIGMDDKIGKIAVGYPAKFTVFDEDLEKFEMLAF